MILSKFLTIGILGTLVLWGNSGMGQSFKFDNGKYNLKDVTETDIKVTNTSNWNYETGSGAKVSGRSSIDDVTVTLVLSDKKKDTQMKGKFVDSKENPKWIKSQKVTVFHHEINEAYSWGRKITKAKATITAGKRTMHNNIKIQAKTGTGLSKDMTERSWTLKTWKGSVRFRGKHSIKIKSTYFNDTQGPVVAERKKKK